MFTRLLIVIVGIHLSIMKSFAMQIYSTWDEAIFDIKDGDELAFGGFGICGIPENLIAALEKKNIKNLTWISNNGGLSDWGLGKLMGNNQVKRMIGGSITDNKMYQNMYLEGKLEVEFIPQGTLAEKLRNGGYGIPAFYTAVGRDTFVEKGGFPILNPQNGEKAKVVSSPKETKMIKGQKYLLEESLQPAYSIVKGWKADETGNVIFRKSARNFNVDVAKAGKIWIVEVEEIVPSGSLDPDNIHLPHVYVQRLIKWDHYEKRIQYLTTSQVKDDQSASTQPKKQEKDSWQLKKEKKRRRIAIRAAKIIKNDMVVNIGTGLPTMIPNFLEPGMKIHFQSENGILGMGGYPLPCEVDSDLINAGKQTIKLDKGGSFFCSSDSFGMIRGGHIDVSLET